MKRSWWIALGSIPVGGMLLLFACGDGRPAATENGSTTPSTGEAPCLDGQIRTCHVILSEQDGIRSCLKGTQQCRGSAWDACVGAAGGEIGALNLSTVGSGLRPSGLPSGGSITTQALSGASGDASVCGPCDPYCVGWDEDAGFRPDASSATIDAGGYFSGTVASLPPAWTKVNAAPCSDSNDCQFDTYCSDAGTCQPYAFNALGHCSGVDLTLPPGCDDKISICNRGDAGTDGGLVKFGVTQNPPPGSGSGSGVCAPFTAKGYPDKGDCTLNLGVNAIPAGQCIRLDMGAKVLPTGVTCTGLNWSGNRDVFVNWDGTYNECDKCNNETVNKASTSCAPPASTTYTQTTYTQQYASSCAVGTRGRWTLLQYDVLTPNSGGSSSVLFEARTAPALADGGPGTFTAWLPIANPPTSPTQTVCNTGGPAGTCPVNLFTKLGGAPNALNQVLQLRITLNPTGDATQGPTVNSYQLSYSCVPAE